MAKKWCPKCQTSRRVKVTRTEYPSLESGDRTVTITMQCAVCQMVIKSENQVVKQSILEQ